MAFCSQCGAEYAVNAKFCHNCGNQVSQRHRTPISSGTTPSTCAALQTTPNSSEQRVSTPVSNSSNGDNSNRLLFGANSM